VYEQRSGKLLRDGRLIAIGYSGHDFGKNLPEAQELKGIGPIPCGEWQIHGPPTKHPSAGPCVLRLAPHPDAETFNRTGFLIHGDSSSKPGTASHGCIILPRSIRDAIWDSGDRVLFVIPGDPTPIEPPPVA
jgi:hypothetical protein